MDFIKQYKWVIILTILMLISIIVKPEFGLKVAGTSWSNLIYLLGILPPIFILVGLIDVWMPKEIVIKFMGEDSGIMGGVLAFTLGSAAAGPLYAAFPVAQIFLKKEASLFNIYLFLGAWSATKVMTFLIETSIMGPTYSITRLLLIIPVIIIIATITYKVTIKDKHKIYQNAKNI